MNQREDRFNKLNKVLGWGNLNAKIIYIGIEEAGNWSILNLLDLFENLKIIEGKYVEKIKLLLNSEKNSIEEHYLIVDLLLKFIDQEGLLNCLNKYLTYYTANLSSGIRGVDDNESVELCHMENFQYYVSKKIIQKDFSYNVCHNEYDSNYFGTTKGNELCLNFYPIGRSNMKINYPEYYQFFGLKGQERFFKSVDNNIDYENERKLMLYDFILEHSKKNDKIIVITLGEIETFKKLFLEMFKNLPEVKPIDFEMKTRGYYYYYQINNISILNTYHPSYNWITFEQIDEILNKHL